MKLPVYTWLRGYDRSWIRGDVIAGLTVWAVLVPEALAYASIAGVSPVVGLYAAPAALILYAAFGSSKHLVIGPMAATAALSAAAVADIAARTGVDAVALTVALAIATGVCGLVAGLIRLDFVASFISEPVLKGLHHRPRPHDHRGPAAAPLRRARDRGRSLRESSGASSRTWMRRRGGPS